MSPVTQGMKTIFMAKGVPAEIATEIAGELHIDLCEALHAFHGEPAAEITGWITELAQEHLDGNLDALGKLLATASIGDEQPIIDAGLPHQLYDHIPAVDLNPLR